MTSQIIELRQANASYVNPDKRGEFTVNFDKVILNEGDEVTIKSSYLDTRTSNSGDGRIHIDDTNNEFNMSHIIYIRNTTTDSPFDIEFFYYDEETGGVQARPSGKAHVLSYNFGAASLRRIRLYTIPGGATGQDEPYETFMVGKDANGQEAKFPVAFKSGIQNGGNISAVATDLTSDIDYTYLPADQGNNTFVSSDFTFHDFDEASKKLNLNANPPTNIIVEDSTHDFDSITSGGHLIPIKFNVKFDIPNGDYEPETLAKFITDQLTKTKMKQNFPQPINITTTEPSFSPDPTLSNVFSGFPTTSPYFTTAKQLKTDGTFGINGLSDLFFVSEDGTSVIEIADNSAGDYILGASEVALVYDEGLNKFMFQQIHSNIIGGANNSEVVVKFKQAGTSGNFWAQGNYSGIAFTDIRSQKCENLLFRDMGFDASILATTTKSAGDINYKKFSDGTTPLSGVNGFTTSLVAGRNMTESLISIDDFYQKNANFYETGGMVDTEISTTDLTSILGNKTKGGGQVGSLDNGYFLIEVSGLPNSSISYGANANNNNQKIKSIVGRYYATSDYTEDQGQGALPFIHRGPSEILSSLSVRILDPDGNNTTEVGNDNSIFIQINRKIPEN